jgi:hypothetical protein
LSSDTHPNAHIDPRRSHTSAAQARSNKATFSRFRDAMNTGDAEFISKMPMTMRAAYVEELGPADNIRYGELPVPVVGPTDVLVEVEAVAVDPVDIFVWAPGGVDLCVDTSGGIDLELACDLLAFRGRIVLLAGAAAALNRCLATGRLLTRIVEVLPLERAADAHRMVERRVRGRVVLRPSHS